MEIRNSRLKCDIMRLWKMLLLFPRLYYIKSLIICQQQFVKGDLFMDGTEVKAMIRNSGVKLWEVADKLGMNDGNFSRRLRKPFSTEEVKRITEITESLASSRAEN